MYLYIYIQCVQVSVSVITPKQAKRAFVAWTCMDYIAIKPDVDVLSILCITCSIQAGAIETAHDNA